MLRAILLPLLALAGGIGGLFLRRWELSTAFEAGGLAIPHAPATLALIVLTVVLAAAFILLCQGKHNELKSYDDAFEAQGNWLYLVLAGLAAAHVLLAALFTLTGFFRGETVSPIWIFLSALCLASLASVLVIALHNFRGGESKRIGLILMGPAYMCCLWLVVAYQQRAGDPVVLDYVYELFAVITALLGLYYAAGFAFDRPKVKRCAVFGLLSVYFSLVTLADSHNNPTTMLVRFVMLYQLASLLPLLYNAFAIKPKRLARKDEETQEVTQDEE